VDEFEQIWGHHQSKLGDIANEDCDDVLVGDECREAATAQAAGCSKEENPHFDVGFILSDAMMNWSKA